MPPRLDGFVVVPRTIACSVRPMLALPPVAPAAIAGLERPVDFCGRGRGFALVSAVEVAGANVQWLDGVPGGRTRLFGRDDGTGPDGHALRLITR